MDQTQIQTPAAAHHCEEHLRHHECDSVEPHGERFRDEWYECSVCGEKFTPEEVDRLQARTKYANGLRQLADLIEENAGLVLPYEGTSVPISFMCHSRKAFAATVRAFGTGNKSESGEGSFASLDFIPDFPLPVRVYGFRNGIGCSRVVKGTRVVPEMVIPAKSAEPERVIPAHEEEIVEWECGAILQEQ